MNNLRNADFSSQTRLLRPNRPAVAKTICLKALSPRPRKRSLFLTLHPGFCLVPLSQGNLFVRLSGVAVSRGSSVRVSTPPSMTKRWTLC
jgi:hypothetical protein